MKIPLEEWCEYIKKNMLDSGWILDKETDKNIFFYHPEETEEVRSEIWYDKETRTCVQVNAKWKINLRVTKKVEE